MFWNPIAILFLLYVSFFILPHLRNDIELLIFPFSKLPECHRISSSLALPGAMDWIVPSRIHMLKPKPPKWLYLVIEPVKK